MWLYSKGKRKGETLELTATPLSEIPIKKVWRPRNGIYCIISGFYYFC